MPPLCGCVCLLSLVSKGKQTAHVTYTWQFISTRPPRCATYQDGRAFQTQAAAVGVQKKKIKTPKLAAELRFASPLVICPGAQQPVDLQGLSKWNSLYLILCQAVLTNREVAVRFHTLDGV